MVVLGNLYAKGISINRSPRRAVRWYKKAVTRVQASHHGNAAIVNEVAWTLTVSNQKGLLKPGYAQAIMDTVSWITEFEKIGDLLSSPSEPNPQIL